MYKASFLGLVGVCVMSLCGQVPSADGGESVAFDFSPDPLAQFRQPPSLRLTCPAVETPPNVDGKLDDVVWNGAAVIERLDNQTPDTMVRVCTDERAIYVGVVCEFHDGQPPQARQVDRDGALWRDDCVEVWITPDLNRVESYQFALNAANSVYDAMNYGGRGQPSHDPQWHHAVSIGETNWTVEMAIPFAAVGLQRWQRRIGFNIGRNGPSIQPRAWSGKYGDSTSSVLVLPAAPERQAVEESEETVADDAKLLTSGEGLRLEFERLEARSGERWIEGSIRLRSTRGELESCELTATLFRPGESQPVDQTAVTPSSDHGTLSVDLRRHGLAKAHLRVTLAEADHVMGCVEAFLSARDPERPLETDTRIAVKLDLPDGIDAAGSWPVTFGVPFPAGALWDASKLRVVDGEGRELPSQCEATGLWAPEGSVKWVRFDALVNSREACYVQVAREPVRSEPARALTLKKRGDDIVVDTGAAVYTLGPGPSPIKEIRSGGRVVATCERTRGLYVVDQKGNVASASAEGEDVRIEADGPVAACVRFEGFYRREDGQQVARHTTRVELFAGQPFARVTHTFTITNDTNEIWFKDVGWELAVMPGAEPKASFGVSREDWRKSTTEPLAGRQIRSMLQDRHYRHAHGENHFRLDRIDEQGTAETILEGEECGDWAALSGSDAGLMISCREAARQHPTEFVVSADKLALMLHSSRAGEELDFRIPTLVKRWDLQNWHEKSTSESRRVPIVERAMKNQSNAIGWSRTSFVTIAPLAPNEPCETAARLSRLTSAQVFAHTDPQWLCASGAMGKIHPKDTGRFPDAERAIDAAFRHWEKRIGDWGDYGFVDYFNGPHLSYRGDYVVQKRYSKAMYTLKVDMWRLYARSGDRRIRTFIENVARTFMDVDVSQWDGDGRIKGLFHSPPGSDLKPSTPHNLPMPWAGPATMHYSSTTNMNLIAWDYYLTGNRRAKDIMFDFAEGAKRHWTPRDAARAWRSLMVFRTLVQTYAFTWDPVVRAMAEATTDQFYDPQCELSLTKNRPYSSTYKTQVDLRAIEDGWNILGGRRYHEILMKMAGRWWTPLMGHWPHFYCNPQGRVGSLLWRETGQPHIPQTLATQLRYSASAYDPEKDHTFGCEGAASCTFIFEGLPYAMETLVRSGWDREPTASWIGYEDFGYPSSVVVRKGDNEAVDLYFVTSNHSRGAPGDIITHCPKVELTDAATRYGLDLYKLSESSTGGAKVRLPKDGPEGAYRITAPARGSHICYADSRSPLVVYAPEYWRPAPAQKPAIRYYFKLPEGTADGQIFFEGSAKLFDPAGEPWNDGDPQHGWVTLPADKPGLWNFLPVENELVGSRNIPPFFAAESASSYFEPDIPWERKPVGEYQPPAPEQVFVAGAIDGADNQAVHLTGKRCFRLEGGPPHPSGDGLRFIPFKQGTIEFWMKPNWHTCDLQPEGSKALIYMHVENGDPWSMWHYVKPRSRNSYNDFLFSHVLYGWFMSDGLAKPTTLRRYRRTVFEPGRWTHIAWVWGKEDGIVPGNPPHHTKVQDDVLVARILVNGKQGSNTGYRWYGNEPANIPTVLNIGRHYASANIDAAVDELRISDVQRYLTDFDPSRDNEFELDEHTRALFHFDGDLQAASWRHEVELPATLTE